MENDFIKNDKPTKLLKTKDINSYKKLAINNANKNNPHKNFTQKKNMENSLYDASVKNKSEINHLLNLDYDNQYNLKLDTKFLSSIFKHNFENSLEPPRLKNETVLNFQKFSNFSFYPTEINKFDNINKFEVFPPLFQYGGQYIINEMHTSLYNNISKIIKLQSYIRGYLSRKKLLIDKSFFEKKSIKAIITIQKHIRGFLARKNIRKKIILKHINQKRKLAIDLIIRNMKHYINVIKIKRIFFINYHLQQRKQKATFIQETFRNNKYYKAFKKLKKEIDTNYFLYYPYKAKKVEIIIYFDDNNKKCKKYSFVYNKLLKCFILLINPCQFFSGKYKCQFVVNDIIVCDERYPTIQHNNGFYNLIDFVTRNSFNCKISPKKIIKKIKIKKVKKDDKNNKLVLSRNNNNNNIELEYDKNLSNSSNIFIDNFKLSLEDIKEEDDEGRSVTSKDYSLCEKRLRVSDKNLKLYKAEENEKNQNIEENNNDDDSFDFTEEEYLTIKKIKNKNIDKTNYMDLKKGLNDKKPNNKLDEKNKTSLKKIKKIKSHK